MSQQFAATISKNIKDGNIVQQCETILAFIKQCSDLNDACIMVYLGNNWKSFEGIMARVFNISQLMQVMKVTYHNTMMDPMATAGVQLAIEVESFPFLAHNIYVVVKTNI